MGLQMKTIQDNLDVVLAAIMMFVAWCGYYIGKRVGYENGMDTGVMAGKDLADRAYARNQFKDIGYGYQMSEIDGSIIRQISDAR